MNAVDDEVALFTTIITIMTVPEHVIHTGDGILKEVTFIALGICLLERFIVSVPACACTDALIAMMLQTQLIGGALAALIAQSCATTCVLLCGYVKIWKSFYILNGNILHPNYINGLGLLHQKCIVVSSRVHVGEHCECVGECLHCLPPIGLWPLVKTNCNERNRLTSMRLKR